MGNQLKTLDSEQLERFIKDKVDHYLGIASICKVKDLDTPNANTRDDRLSFKVEISYDETIQKPEN
jgi:hypothetical protein